MGSELSARGHPVGCGREWTLTLVPPGQLSRWAGRLHAEMSFHLTQLITGHGCFNRFLNGIGHARLPGCLHCGASGEPGEEDDAFHTLMRCEAFEGNREFLVRVIELFDPEGKVPLMIENRANCEAVAGFVTYVMTAKDGYERSRLASNKPGEKIVKEES